MSAADSLPDQLRLDDLTFRVLRSPKRSTVGITVERDGSLLLRVPEHAPRPHVEAWVRRKRPWVLDKLAKKDLLLARQPDRSFVSGEGFDYLGRRYRLKIADDVESVHFAGGRIRMNPSVAQGPDPAAALIGWYTGRAHRRLPRRLRSWQEATGLHPGSLHVRDLGYRWGSLGKNRRLNLHWAIMQLPLTVIDYVLVHELAHLAVADHSPAFWDQVRAVVPDYEKRKERLAVLGAQLWLG
ncbi:M48 family metallopeptidase [Streptomonospora salina]|uniref:Putative metal-dependent hydrolase n=1 Tax=Streptomonospora salina TaxID=104205 RepID=A0A841DZY7_9ACTN|nr:SprT family zinc-dependent metalloprotease [Streptomonospora salina]MBB5996445.1 putative metal-dependent hydrolase [Streptomonospora salina]